MKLTIGRKLALAFGMILLLMLGSAVAASYRAAEIGKTQQIVTQLRIPTVTLLKDLQRDLNQTESKGREITLAGTEPTRRDEARKGFESDWEDVDKDVKGLTELAPNWSLQENRDRLDQIKEQLPKLRQVQEESMQLAASGVKDAVVMAVTYLRIKRRL